MLLLAGATVAVGLTERGPDRWWWVGGFAVSSVANFLGTINSIYGRVLRTARGLEFRTFVSRHREAAASVAERDLVGSAGRPTE
ncbi:hypothetical protein ACQEV9_00765 [Streptomyces chartreusis]|uniref:hypothetical protein n=1 Tax=Streptomyces chartreusis TaxID=1969 RepID=UPI003D8B4964